MSMLALFGKWLINSRAGQTLLLALAIMVAVYATYKVIDTRAYDRGRADCTAEVIAKAAKETQRQNRENIARNAAASEIATVADTTAAAAVKETDTNTNETKEVIRHVYHTRYVTKPIAPGSCVHPVDKRVQDRISGAVDSANRI